MGILLQLKDKILYKKSLLFIKSNKQGFCNININIKLINIVSNFLNMSYH